MTESSVRSQNPVLFLVGGEIRGGKDDSLRRAQEHIGRLLALKTLVVLFGSGSCFHLNGLSIRALTIQAIDDLVRAHARDSLDADELQMLKSLTARSSECIDLESLLSTLNSTINFIHSVDAARLNLDGHALREDLLKSIRRKLNAALADACDLESLAETLEEPLKSSPWRPHQLFFRKLLYSRRADLPPTQVFTTNYDLAIENALDASGIDYIDGFKGTVQRSYHPETYNQALFLAPGPDQRRLLPVPSMLYYYKLHGSMNWRFATSEGRRTIVQRRGKVTDDASLAVIFPTQEKEMDTVGFPYADLFRSFGDALQSADVGVITIGYGFNDAHINRILNTALSTNYSMQLVIIDPSAVYQDYSVDIKDLVFADTAIARIVKQSDARVSSVTGSGAAFTVFTETLMPDIDSETFSESDGTNAG